MASATDNQTIAELYAGALLDLAQALLGLSTNPIPIKTALALRGLVREEFRLPMCPMDAATRAKLESVLQRHNLLGSVTTEAPGTATAPQEMRT